MTKPLDERIAAALGGPTTSAALGDLLTEVEAAIGPAQTAVEQARARMLDPRQPVDARTRQALQDATVTADRLAASVAPLQKRAGEVFHAEELARHRPRAEALAAQRDALAAQLEALYRPFAEQVVPVLAAVEALDVKIRELNFVAPSGARSLCSTEEAARGPLAGRDLLIARDLKLPPWGASDSLAWPPYRGIDPALASPMPSAHHPDAYTDFWWRVA